MANTVEKWVKVNPDDNPFNKRMKQLYETPDSSTPAVIQKEQQAFQDYRTMKADSIDTSSAAGMEAYIWQMTKPNSMERNDLYAKMDLAYSTPGSQYYRPYTVATNQALIDDLAARGIDVSGGINDEFFANNAQYIGLADKSSLTGTPSSPGKRGTNEQWISYDLYQLQKDEATTKKVESEWEALQKELTYYANKGLTNNEIKAKIDWNNYKTLQKLDENAKLGAPTLLNRATTYSQDAIDGVIWNVRNGSNEDPFKAAVYYRMGRGATDNKNTKAQMRRTPGTAEYNPYVDGATNDKYRMMFDVPTWDTQWLQDKQTEVFTSGDNARIEAYKKMWDIETTTEAAENELEALQKRMASAKYDDDYYATQLSEGKTPRELAEAKVNRWLEGDELTKFNTLKKMDSERQKGGYLELSRSVNYRYEDIVNEVEEQIRRANGLNDKPLDNVQKYVTDKQNATTTDQPDAVTPAVTEPNSKKEEFLKNRQNNPSFQPYFIEVEDNLSGNLPNGMRVAAGGNVQSDVQFGGGNKTHYTGNGAGLRFQSLDTDNIYGTDDLYTTLGKIVRGEELNAKEQDIATIFDQSLNWAFGMTYAGYGIVTSESEQRGRALAAGRDAWVALQALDNDYAKAQDLQDTYMQLFLDGNEAYKAGMSLDEYYRNNPEELSELQAIRTRISDNETLTKQAEKERAEADKAANLASMQDLLARYSSGQALSQGDIMQLGSLEPQAGMSFSDLEKIDPYLASIENDFMIPQYYADIEAKNAAGETPYSDDVYAAIGERAMRYYAFDANMAKAAGMTLEEMYQKYPNMRRDFEQVWGEAEKQFLAQANPDNIAENEKAGLGFILTVGTGINLGAQTWWSNTTGAVSDINDLMHDDTDMRSTNYQMYLESSGGSAVGARRAFRRDIETYINTLREDGDENKAAAYEQMLAQADAEDRDIFGLPINLTREQIEDLHTKQQQNINEVRQFVAENATAGEARWVNDISSATNSVIGMAVSSLVTAGFGGGASFGARALGTAFGFGMQSFDSSYRDFYEKTGDKAGAAMFGMVMAAVETLTEADQLSKYYNIGGNALSSLVKDKLMKEYAEGGLKGFAKYLAGSFVVNGIEEVGQEIGQNMISSSVENLAYGLYNGDINNVLEGFGAVASGALDSITDLEELRSTVVSTLLSVGLSSAVSGSVQYYKTPKAQQMIAGTQNNAPVQQPAPVAQQPTPEVQQPAPVIPDTVEGRAESGDLTVDDFNFEEAEDPRTAYSEWRNKAKDKRAEINTAREQEQKATLDLMDAVNEGDPNTIAAAQQTRDEAANKLAALEGELADLENAKPMGTVDDQLVVTERQVKIDELANREADIRRQISNLDQLAVNSALSGTPNQEYADRKVELQAELERVTSMLDAEREALEDYEADLDLDLDTEESADTGENDSDQTQVSGGEQLGFDLSGADYIKEETPSVEQEDPKAQKEKPKRKRKPKVTPEAVQPVSEEAPNEEQQTPLTEEKQEPTAEEPQTPPVEEISPEVAAESQKDVLKEEPAPVTVKPKAKTTNARLTEAIENAEQLSAVKTAYKDLTSTEKKTFRSVSDEDLRAFLATLGDLIDANAIKEQIKAFVKDVKANVKAAQNTEQQTTAAPQELTKEQAREQFVSEVNRGIAENNYDIIRSAINDIAYKYGLDVAEDPNYILIDDEPIYFNGAFGSETRDNGAPLAPVEQPAPPVEQPAPPVEQPVPPVEQPAPPVEQPASPVEQPTSPTEQQAPPVEQQAPSTPVEQPVPPAGQTAPTVQPVDTKNLPKVDFTQSFEASLENLKTLRERMVTVMRNARITKGREAIEFLKQLSPLVQRIRDAQAVIDGLNDTITPNLAKLFDEAKTKEARSNALKQTLDAYNDAMKWINGRIQYMQNDAPTKIKKVLNAFYGSKNVKAMIKRAKANEVLAQKISEGALSDPEIKEMAYKMTETTDQLEKAQKDLYDTNYDLAKLDKQKEKLEAQRKKTTAEMEAATQAALNGQPVDPNLGKKLAEQNMKMAPVYDQIEKMKQKAEGLKENVDQLKNQAESIKNNMNSKLKKTLADLRAAAGLAADEQVEQEAEDVAFNSIPDPIVPAVGDTVESAEQTMSDVDREAMREDVLEHLDEAKSTMQAEAFAGNQKFGVSKQKLNALNSFINGDQIQGSLIASDAALEAMSKLDDNGWRNLINAVGSAKNIASIPSIVESALGLKVPVTQAYIAKRDRNRNAPKTVQQNAIPRRSPYQVAQKLASDIGTALYNPAKRVTGFSKGTLGYYMRHGDFIAINKREANNYYTTMHEIGHALQEKTGMATTVSMVANLNPALAANYPPQDIPGEAFAEFCRTYISGKSLAESIYGAADVDTFEQKLKENGLYDSVIKAQNDIAAFRIADAQQKIGAMITRYQHKDQATGLNTYLKNKGRKGIIGQLDSTWAATRFDNAMGRAEDSLGLRERMILTRTAGAGKAMQLIEERMTDMAGNDLGSSLEEAYGLKKDADFALWDEYALALHALDREDVGRALSREMTVFGKAIDDDPLVARKQLQDFVDNIQSTRPDIAESHNRVMQWWQQFMQTYMVDTGLISQDTADYLQTTYPNYVPTFRDLGSANTSAGMDSKDSYAFHLHEIVGSDLDIISPTQGLMSIIGETVKSAYVNNALEAVWDAIQSNAENYGDFAVEAKGPGSDTMVYLEDGEKHYLKFADKDLMNAIISTVNPTQVPGVFRGIGKLTRTMSSLTTGSNPLFAISNFARDFQQSVNHGSWAATYVDGAVKWLISAWDVATNNDAFKQYENVGGKGFNNTRLAQTEKEADAVMRNLYKDFHKNGVQKAAGMAGKAAKQILTFEWLNDTIEKTSRYAEFKFGNHDLTTDIGRQRAYLAGQEVTTNFALNGNSQTAAVLRKLIPFYNATLQGTWQAARIFTQEERGRLPQRMTKLLVNNLLLGALQYGLLSKFGDDEDKKWFERLADSIKYDYIVLPFFDQKEHEKRFIRLPLAQSPYTKLFYQAGQQIMRAANGDNLTADLTGMVSHILNNTYQADSIFAPIIAMMTNKNYYGGTLIPSRLKDLNPTQQTTDSVPEIFNKASRTIQAFSDALTGGNGTSISPIYLQYMMEQWTGFIGQVTIPALSRDKMSGAKTENFVDFMMRLPGTVRHTLQKRWTVDPAYTNDINDAYYKGLNTLTQVIKGSTTQGYSDLLDNRDPKKAQEAVDIANYLNNGPLKAISEQISQLYNEQDKLYNDDTLTEMQRYTRRNALQEQIVEKELEALEYTTTFREDYTTGGKDIFAFVMTGGPKVHKSDSSAKYGDTFIREQDTDWYKMAKEVYDMNPNKTSALPHPELKPSYTNDNGEDVEVNINYLPKEQYDLYMGKYKAAYAEVLASYSPEWDGMTEEQKRKVLSSAHSAGNAAAKYYLIDNHITQK